jgi:hypothetical protein
MKKLLIASALVLTTITGAQAQGWKDVLKGVANNVGNSTGTQGGGSIGSLSNQDIVAGLRQALEVGAQNASGRLNAVNGFFGNALIKVLMPPEAKNVENSLRSLGFRSVVDKAILSMNRAAEDAAGKAVPIFVDAIRNMNIQDGLNILKGGNGAATAFLRNATTGALTNAFRPVIQTSLNKVGATSYWGDVMKIYNRLPTTRQQINPDLTAYVTERALNGLFVNIADEENKIRTNPAARVSDILKKVFGAK